MLSAYFTQGQWQQLREGSNITRLPAGISVCLKGGQWLERKGKPLVQIESLIRQAGKVSQKLDEERNEIYNNRKITE